MIYNRKGEESVFPPFPTDSYTKHLGYPFILPFLPAFAGMTRIVPDSKKNITQSKCSLSKQSIAYLVSIMK